MATPRSGLLAAWPLWVASAALVAAGVLGVLWVPAPQGFAVWLALGVALVCVWVVRGAPSAESERVNSDTIIDRLLELVPPPKSGM